MIGISRLTVRPLPKDGESLSSYILRACEANMILYRNLLSHVQHIKSKSLLYKSLARVDVIPQQKHNMLRLAEVLGKTEKRLFEMTFDNLRLKLNMYGFYFEGQFTALMNHLLETKKRKFCPHCLEENLGFQMLWQVKDINHCIKHKIKLRTSCPSCNHDQAYNHNKLGLYRCDHCNELLFKGDQQLHEVNDLLLLQSQQGYAEWKYILDIEQPLFPKEIEELGLEKTICVALIYILQRKVEESPTQYRYRLVKKILRHDYLHSILRFVNDESSPQKVSFPRLLKLLIKENIPLEDFTKIVVPMSYVNSLKRQEPQPIIEECLAPWCSTYQKADGLFKIPGSNNFTLYKNERYLNYSICINCGTRYGINIKSREWVDFTGKIELINNVVLMLWFDKNESEIKQSLNLFTTALNDALGYALRYNLLPDKKRVVFEKYTQSNLQIIKCFQEIYLDDSKIKKFSLKKTHGWHEIEYYYHLYNPEVQYFRWIEYTNKKRFENTERVLRAQTDIEEKLIDTVYSDDITIKEIAASFDVHFASFERLGFVKKVQEIKKEKLKKNSEAELLEKVMEYFKVREQENLPIYLKDVYKHFGIYHNSPVPLVLAYIKEQSALSKIKWKEHKMKELMDKADEFILSEYSIVGKVPTLRDIATEIGLIGKIHTKFRPVLEHIRETIQSLDTD